MSFSLNDLFASGTNSQPTGEQGGSQISLDNIANSFLQGISNKAVEGVGKIIDKNTVRSQNTQPTPDLTAAAAMPQVSAFVNSSAFGVSMPILLVGVGALAFILLKR